MPTSGTAIFYPSIVISPMTDALVPMKSTISVDFGGFCNLTGASGAGGAEARPSSSTGSDFCTTAGVAAAAVEVGA
jgi:hypothetical protein